MESWPPSSSATSLFGGMSLAMIGAPADLTYDYLHLGSTTKTLVIKR